MKPKKLIIYPNGFQIRKHNVRVSVIEEEGCYSFTFQNYIGVKKTTAIASNTRGIAETSIKIKKDTLDEIMCSYVEYQMHKNEKS
jgi:hypothetical protein